jgi:hypothetical protein
VLKKKNLKKIKNFKIGKINSLVTQLPKRTFFRQAENAPSISSQTFSKRDRNNNKIEEGMQEGLGLGLSMCTTKYKTFFSI